VRKTYPVEAVEFIRASGKAGARVFNDYMWGGYLIRSGIPVFIDGRGEIFGKLILDDYLSVNQLKDDWMSVLDKYRIEMILVPKEHPIRWAAVAEGWKLVHTDSTAVVLARN
jgi:hypothetical protein